MKKTMLFIRSEICCFLLIVCLSCSAVSSVEDERYNRVTRRELDPQTCVDNFEIQRDKIIRTEESREMGAKYLNEVDIGTRDECHRLCCETDTCDVFVFEEKIPGSCYLFHCGPPENFKCKFTRHSNFTSGVLALSRAIAELEDQAKLIKHEQDLARLRRPSQKPTAKPQPTVLSAPQIHTTTVGANEVRRCSRYQFECHTGGECIAIYNACDGIPQCADGSDEGPELGCPSQMTTSTSTTLPPKLPQREISPEQEYRPKVEADPVIFRQPIQDVPSWMNKPDKIIETEKAKAMQTPRIFNHKNNLLSNSDNSQIPQYVPFIPVQDSQWTRRQWTQPVGSENDGRMIYRYPGQEWKQQAQIPYSGYEGQAPIPMENPVVQMEPMQNLVPMIPLNNREKLERMPVMGAPQDKEKMWGVPQMSMPNPEPPVYQAPKNMPETPIMYSNKQGTLRDGPKKGFSLMKISEEKQIPEKPVTVEPSTIATQAAPSIDNKIIKKSEAVHNKTDDNNIEVKVVAATTATKDEAKPMIKHDVKHDYFTNVDDEHEGFSEKPPGAIFLLILGILMTSIMATMLVCRIRVMRWRVRTRGGGKAYDADYLVNGMYL